MALKRDISLRHKNSTELVNRLKQKRINHDKENVIPNELSIIDENVNLLDTSTESDSYIQVQLKTDSVNIPISDEEEKVVEKFLNLVSSESIHQLFCFDQCKIYTHRWALAYVAVYYCRLKPKQRKFTEDIFLKLLYLANDMINDHEFHCVLLTWAFQLNQSEDVIQFKNHKDRLWSMMDHRAHVSLDHLERIIQIRPEHFVWSRQCDSYHFGAYRQLPIQLSFDLPLPEFDPCQLCTIIQNRIDTCNQKGLPDDDVSVSDLLEVQTFTKTDSGVFSDFDVVSPPPGPASYALNNLLLSSDDE